MEKVLWKRRRWRGRGTLGENHTFKLDVLVRFEQRPEEVREDPKQLVGKGKFWLESSRCKGPEAGSHGA